MLEVVAISAVEDGITVVVQGTVVVLVLRIPGVSVAIVVTIEVRLTASVVMLFVTAS
jgi:hypothetical protein